MADDLRALLTDAAPRPTAPLDARGLVRRARCRRRVAQGLTGGAAVMLLVAAATVLPGIGRDRVVFDQPIESPAPVFDITAEARPYPGMASVQVAATDPGRVSRGEVVQHELVITNLDDAPARVDAWLHMDEDIVDADGAGSLRVLGACASTRGGDEACPSGGIVAQPGEPLRLPLRLRTAHLVEGVYRLGMPLFIGEEALAGAPPPPIQLTYRVTQVAEPDAPPERDARGEPERGPHDGEAVLDPERMRVEPPAAEPGEVVELHYDLDTMRGVAFTLELLRGDGWELRFFLHSDGGGGGAYEPHWWRAGEDGGWDDIGIGGPGPDLVVIPQVAEPGAYRICTANARPNFCAPVEVRGSPVPQGDEGQDQAPKCAPPAPSLSLQAMRDGEPLEGNDWELAASPDDPAALTIEAAVQDGVSIDTLRFEAAPAASPSPGSAVWLHEVARELAPGSHTFDLVWDATDDAGRPVPRGRYHLTAYAEVTVTEASDGPCGRRPGRGGQEGLGLGYVTVG